MRRVGSKRKSRLLRFPRFLGPSESSTLTRMLSEMVKSLSPLVDHLERSDGKHDDLAPLLRKVVERVMALNGLTWDEQPQIRFWKALACISLLASTILGASLFALTIYPKLDGKDVSEPQMISNLSTVEARLLEAEKHLAQGEVDAAIGILSELQEMDSGLEVPEIRVGDMGLLPAIARNRIRDAFLRTNESWRIHLIVGERNGAETIRRATGILEMNGFRSGYITGEVVSEPPFSISCRSKGPNQRARCEFVLSLLLPDGELGQTADLVGALDADILGRLSRKGIQPDIVLFLPEGTRFPVSETAPASTTSENRDATRGSVGAFQIRGLLPRVEPEAAVREGGPPSEPLEDRRLSEDRTTQPEETALADSTIASELAGSDDPDDSVVAVELQAASDDCWQEPGQLASRWRAILDAAREFLPAEPQKCLELALPISFAKLRADGGLPIELAETLYRASGSWNLNAGDSREYPVYSTAYSPDGEWFASASASLDLWRVEDGKRFNSSQLLPQPLLAIDFSGDGHHIAGVGLDGSLVRFYADRQEEGRRLRMVEVVSGHRPTAGKNLFDPDDLLDGYFLEFQQGGSILVAPGYGGKLDSIEVIQPFENSVVHSFKIHAGEVVTAAISPDGIVAAVSDNSPAVSILDMTSGRVESSFRLVGTSAVTALKFSPDSAWLAGGDKAGNLRIWSLDGGLVNQRKAHGAAVRSLEYTPDGRGLISASSDGTIQLWHPLSLAPVLQLAQLQSEVLSLSIGPDGRRLVAGELNGGLHMFPLGDSALIAWATRRLGNGNTSAYCDYLGLTQCPTIAQLQNRGCKFED